MFNFLRKKPKSEPSIWRVQYVHCATIDPSAGEGGTATFDLKWLKEAYVKANNVIEAQTAFASTVMLTPHVYIHDVRKLDIRTLNK